MKPKVSIIVPAFNEERFLARTLASLVNQTYPNTELIVIDNASTDGTNAIARRFSDHVVVETRKGYIAAVMRGVSESDGALMTFCDADTLYPSDWLEKVVRVFAANPTASAVYGSCWTHDASSVMNRVNGFLSTFFRRFSRLFGMDLTAGYNFVMRRSAYDAVGGFDPHFKRMGPDVELGRRLARVGPLILRSSNMVEASFRRYREGGVLKTQWMYMKAWWQLLHGGLPSLSYSEYNTTRR